MIFIKTLKNTTLIKNVILIVFDNMIADMLSNKKLNPVVTELFKHFSCFDYTILFSCTNEY